MKTIVDLINKSSKKFRDNTALQIFVKDDYKKISYHDLSKASDNVCAFLKKAGMRKGDHIAIITDNTPLWGMVFFGVLKAGCTLVPVDRKLKEQDFKYILEHAEIKYLFVSPDLLDTVTAVSSNLRFLNGIVALDLENKYNGFLSLGEILSFSFLKDELLPVKINENDPALIIYTSGTTGKPKGVMLSHLNIFSDVEGIKSFISFSEKDHFLSVLPLCHAYAITADFLVPLFNGATVTYVEALTPKTIIHRMREVQATVIITVPALLNAIYFNLNKEIKKMGRSKKYIFHTCKAVSKICSKAGINAGSVLFKKIKNTLSPRLRFFISGGAPVDPDLVKNFKIFGLPVYQGYGLTETSPILSVEPEGASRPGSVGKPIKDVEVKIIPVEYAEHPQGEIIVKGPNVMMGYFKDDKATGKMIVDGWLHTGDIGTVDKDGYVYITGRIKNVIITSGGKNISPEEIEEKLQRSPFIKDVCIIGKKRVKYDGRMGEEVFALIVPNYEYIEFLMELKKKQIPVDREQLHKILSDEVKKVNTSLAVYKRITDFDICEELPKTTTLKVKRKEAEKLASGH